MSKKTTQPYAHKELLPQNSMFDLPESWEMEWQGMPEFVQRRQKPYAQIIVRFANEDDLQDFAKLIGQKLTRATKSLWHPELLRGRDSAWRYTDES